MEGDVKLRIAAAVVLAVGITLGTAGCNFLVPQSTLRHYDASDGVSGNVGQVGVRNAILISADGSSANLVVTFVNGDAKSHRIGIQDNSSGKTTFHVTIPANSTQKVGTPGEPAVIFDSIDAKPGALHTLFFQYGDKTGASLLVPVLDGSLNSYQDLTPAAIMSKDPAKIVTG